MFVMVMSRMKAVSVSTRGLGMTGSAGSWMCAMGAPRKPRPNAFPTAPPAMDMTSAITTIRRIALVTLSSISSVYSPSAENSGASIQNMPAPAIAIPSTRPISKNNGLVPSLTSSPDTTPHSAYDADCDVPADTQ